MSGEPRTENAPAPKFDVTYRRADGDLIFDEYAWVADLDGWFDDDDEPVELIEERWQRTSVRTFWRLPESLYDCGLSECDEDAVGWVQTEDGKWSQRCAEHGGEAS